MAGMSVAEEIRELEMQRLEPSVRASPERLDVLLAEEFVEFGSSGRTFDKKGIMESLEREGPVEISVRDFRVGELGPDVALATYRARVRRGEARTSRSSLRSSIWIRRQGRWQITFHQGTPSPEEGNEE
jgi:hypothetical protein